MVKLIELHVDFHQSRFENRRVQEKNEPSDGETWIGSRGELQETSGNHGFYIFYIRKKNIGFPVEFPFKQNRETGKKSGDGFGGC